MTTPATDPIVESVMAAVEELRRIWGEIVRGVNSALGTLPVDLANQAITAFNDLAAKITEVLDALGQLRLDYGSPTAVRQVADAWGPQVGAKAGEQAGLLALGQLDSTGQWSGIAATRYTQVVNGQTKALTEVKTLSDAAQTALSEIAEAMNSFWSGIAVATGSYVALMAGCVVGSATGVGTIPSLIAALGFTVAYAAALAKLRTDYDNAMEGKRVKLEQVVTQNTAFAGDAWPPATAQALSNTEGDRDWKVPS